MFLSKNMNTETQPPNLQHFAFIPAKLVPEGITPEEESATWKIKFAHADLFVVSCIARLMEKDNEIARLIARLNDATDILRSIRFDLPTNTVGRENIEYFLEQSLTHNSGSTRNPDTAGNGSEAGQNSVLPTQT